MFNFQKRGLPGWSTHLRYMANFQKWGLLGWFPSLRYIVNFQKRGFPGLSIPLRYMVNFQKRGLPRWFIHSCGTTPRIQWLPYNPFCVCFSWSKTLLSVKLQENKMLLLVSLTHYFLFLLLHSVGIRYFKLFAAPVIFLPGRVTVITYHWVLWRGVQ